MSISTLSISSSSRASILRIQTELRNAEKEQADLRHADVGRTLGGATANAISYRSEATSLSRQIETNKIVDTNLELTDNSLSTLVDGAEAMRTALLSAISAKDIDTIKVVVNQARTSLEQMAGALNLTVGGRAYFGGDNIEAQTLTVADGSLASRNALTAFRNTLGPPVPSVAELTPAQIETFAAGDYAALFAADPLTTVDPWKLNWSNASDGAMTARISTTETVTTSLSANEQAFRDLAAAYSMVADLDVASMNESARIEVFDQARARLETGLSGTNALKAELGFRRGRIEAADKQLTLQMDIAKAAFGTLEEVDFTEAALKITRLETQLEATYTVTGRLQGLNILNYL